MTRHYEEAVTELKGNQRDAVEWQDGSALVLAGPGSGKTRVLTTRIARILAESPDQTFRVLALTFTNKAADEMTARVERLCPDTESRRSIGTFHSFCTDLLRQHGVHLGIQTNFAIYSLEEDRREVLQDALRRMSTGAPAGHDENRVLRTIDGLMNRFATPETAPTLFRHREDGVWYAELYRRYGEQLSALNALDFNSLLLQAFRLVTTYPAIAARYRRTYRYWMIDEFQDTNAAQYRIITALAGADFRNVFVVADDDQIIYEWNGASYRQIVRFREEFSPELIQLPTNYRCPAAIVGVANDLVQYNRTRTPQKLPLLAGKTTTQLPETEHIRVLTYNTDGDEASGIADHVAEAGAATWGNTIVLARNRALLDALLAELRKRDVSALIAQRRDHFLTPHFQWLQGILHQVVRPLDKRNFRLTVDAYNRMTGASYAADDLIAEAETLSVDYLGVWAKGLEESADAADGTTGAHVSGLRGKPEVYGGFVDVYVKRFESDAVGEQNEDLSEDCVAWRELRANIAHTIDRNASLDQFLQQLDLRSKEPSPRIGSVRLMTIHAAKGTEADYVYVIGMAEEIIPSFQSVRAGEQSSEMEEERRNCFVAVTRTKEQLTLSTARQYRGWQKKPSRFLREMGLLSE